MNFKELQDLIPYAKGGKLKSLTMQPYDGVTLAMPGRHWKDTTPVGGDFVVMIDTPVLKKHQFKHDDIFEDFEIKKTSSPGRIDDFTEAYLDIILGVDPVKYDGRFDCFHTSGINPYLFLRAVQCLAVAEHRRYARFEPQFGGRYLPYRFAAGIVAAEWTAQDAIGMQKLGRPGVESLEKKYGLPKWTEQLFEALSA